MSVIFWSDIGSWCSDEAQFNRLVDSDTGLTCCSWGCDCIRDGLYQYVL
jgi:hypothetical protein